VLGVDHELGHAGAVAEVDEHEAAVVAPAGDPAGERDPLADELRARLAAHVGAPAGRRSHRRRGPTTSAWASGSSSCPRRRSVAPSGPTITIVRAPARPARVSWPFSERPP